MAYFVTGATGFIGRFLVAQPAASAASRSTCSCARARSRSSTRCASAGAPTTSSVDRASIGDLAKPNLGVSAATCKKLKGKVEHFFHLAAIYDLKASAEASRTANIDGTRNAVQFARGGRRRLLPPRELDRRRRPVRRHVPRGHVRGGRGPRPSVLQDQARLRRRSCARNASGPFRIYRPGFVVGHSKTGYIDKIDGPYYFFKLLQKMRNVAAAVDADGRHRGRPHQHRAGRLRRRRARPPRAQEGPRRQVLPPDRPGAASHRRSAQHLRQGRARAADDDAPQRADVRLHPGADPLRAGLARAGASA